MEMVGVHGGVEDALAASTKHRGTNREKRGGVCRRGTRRELDGDDTFSSFSWTTRCMAGSGPSMKCSWVWVCVVGERREHGGEESELGSGELSPMFLDNVDGGAC